MGLIVLLVVGLGLGRFAFRGLEVGVAERVALQLFVGLCLAAVLLVLVGSFSLRTAYWMMLVAAATALVYHGWAYPRETRKSPVTRVQRDPLTRLETTCLVVAVAASLLAVFSALAPNTNWDAGAAHLALPSDYVREGHIGLIEGNVYSGYPHLLHTLYTFTYMSGGEVSASILSWLFGPLACVALYSLGKRVGGRRCGLVAAAVFASSPIFFDQVGTVSIDVAFAGLSIAALACFVAWHDERRTNMLVLAAFLAGSSCGIRHTGYLVCALLLAGVVAVARERRLATIGVFCAIVSLAAAPWLIRSAAVTGNPFYPFLSGIFTSPAMPDLQTTTLAQHETVGDLGPAALIRFPWDLIMRPEAFDGWSTSPGALVLLLGVPGLFLGGARVRWLGAYCVAGLVCFFFFQRFARYALPFFMPMMVVAAAAYWNLPRIRRPLTALLVLFFCYGLALGAGTVHFKVPVALGFESDQDYLSKRIERYGAFRWVNEHVPPGDSVMTLDPRSYFIERPTFQNYAVLPSLAKQSREDQLSWFSKRNIRYLVYPPAYFKGSPAYVVRGYTEIVESWIDDKEHFKLVGVIDEAQSRRDGLERVEIYEIVTGPAAAESRVRAQESDTNVGA